MRYISTRGETPAQTFQEAVLTGLAPDGGLLIPEHIPRVSEHLDAWSQLDFIGLAQEIVALFAPDIERVTLDALVRSAYESFDHPDVVGLVPVGDVHVLELFHGPTLAFKDIALQLLGRLFRHILDERGERLNIIGATSGDTGSAAIAGVRGQPNIDIFVMFPKGRVSPLQQLQMTSVPDTNVYCLEVDGSFDDCQSMLKQTFGDLEFKRRFALGAVNSVNWARVLAQVIYYAYASLRLGRERPVSFAVPTGNFGNVFAGYVARRMGLPIDRLIVATNENDILARFFASGRYRRDDVRFTVTPAMDIQVASNFERYLYFHLDRDPALLRRFMQDFAETGDAALDRAPPIADFEATAVAAEDTLRAITKTYEQHRYVADPHTAVGIAAAARVPRSGPTVCVATAHPAKFPESVDSALGAPLARHPRLEALRGLPQRLDPLAAKVDALKHYVAEHCGEAE
ncbi:MAG: threonine synthase [Pseudomonadota bacterium]